MDAVSEKTVKMYQSVMLTVIKQARKSLVEARDPTPLEMVYSAWDYFSKGNICKRTWRMRKAAMRMYFKAVGSPEAMEASDTLDTLQSRTVRPPLIKRTSQKKEKSISLADEATFIEHLLKRRDSGHVLAGVLHDWIIATRYCGARPCEWEETSCNGRNVRVQNAKATQGRSHGKHRTVPIDYLPQEKRDIIIRHINYIQHWKEQGNQYEELQESMKNTIYRESRLCWPRRKGHVSLYTFRHQFSANLKATGLDKDSVAALMGHASNETAGRHYARKIVGNPIEGIYAASDDLRRVRALNQNRKPNVHPRAASKEQDNQDSL